MDTTAVLGTGFKLIKTLRVMTLFVVLSVFALFSLIRNEYSRCSFSISVNIITNLNMLSCNSFAITVSIARLQRSVRLGSCKKRCSLGDTVVSLDL